MNKNKRLVYSTDKGRICPECNQAISNCECDNLKKLKVPDTAYSFKVLPLLGKLIANDADSYRYLAESIRMHPSQTELAEMMREAGFNRVEYFNLSAGVVALHRGFKS